MSALRAEAVAALPFPLRLRYSLCSPGKSQSRLWCAGLLGLSALPLPLFADSCSQGCWVCALIFQSRLEALSVFSLSLLLTSRGAEHPSLNLSGGGDLQESCRYWPLPQGDSDNCVQVSVRCRLSPAWGWRRAMLGCHAVVDPHSWAAGDGGTSFTTLSDTAMGGQ